MPESDDPRYTMNAGALPAHFEASRVGPSLAVPAPDVWPVKIVDVSFWQGVIDFSILRQKAQVIYIRAGYGNDGLDPKGQVNAARAQSAGMPWGLYWYVKVGKDFKKHVASFKAACQEYGGVMPPVFDCENTEYIVNVKNNTGNWLTKLVKNWQDATGVDPIIYTSAYWWNSKTYRMDWPKSLLLFAAQYNSYISTPLIPDDWGKITNPKPWSFWQWSADGNGQGESHGVESAAIDLDRFNGSIADFNKKFGTNIKPLGEVVPPVDPPADDLVKPLYRVRVNATALNVRGGPGATYSDLGELVKGSVIPVVEESGDWLRVDGWMNKNYVKRI